MFAAFGLSVAELIVLLVIGLILLGGLAVGVGLILYFALRKKKPAPVAQTPPATATPPKL